MKKWNIGYYEANSLNVRSGPTTNSAIIYNLKNAGEVIELENDSNNQWVKIRVHVKGKGVYEGYVFQPYLKLVPIELDITNETQDTRTFIDFPLEGMPTISFENDQEREKTANIIEAISLYIRHKATT